MSALHHQFAQPLLAWHAVHGRHDLPWQNPKTAYHVWISEVMLQQTQVKTVIPYFTQFIQHFPDVQSLANATEDKVLALWSGLGYYSRGRNLYKAAQVICEQHHGNIPDTTEELIKLPGIGESTAAAIASLAYNKRTAILDGNVKRVLSRYFLIKDNLDSSKVKQRLWTVADECMPSNNCSEYTQAIMDLGATCCLSKNPNCHRCPLNATCQAFLHKQTADIPKKKAKKKKPSRAQDFLLIHHNNHIFLEKRPSSGIWGGLWCLPSMEPQQCPVEFLDNQFSLKTQKPVALTTFTHTFTHFSLQINAYSLELATNHPHPALRARFFDPPTLGLLGLPKPVSKIIQYFYEHYQKVELSCE